MNSELGVVESAAGRCATGQPSRPIGLPLDAVVTGSGLLVAEPAAGGVASAVTIVEALLNRGVGCLVVDADETLGGRLSPQLDHWAPRGAGPDGVGRRVASTVDGTESVVLDLSARPEPGRHLDAAARALADAASDAGQRWVLVVADLERFAPPTGDGGGAGATLGRLAAGGRSREVGLLATVTSPAGVDPAFLEACDWRLWHRLSASDERSVVRRLLDGEHARALRDLSDGEAILDASWHEDTERVRVDRPTPATGGPDRDMFQDLRADIAEVIDRLERIEAAVGAETPSEEPSTEVPFDTLATDPPASDSKSTVDDGPVAGSNDSGGDDALAALAGVGDEPPADGARDEARLVGDGGPNRGSIARELPTFEAGVDGVASSPRSGTDRSAVVVDLESTLSDLDPAALSVLRAYRSDGPLEPKAAYERATGSERRVRAYAHNRRLRRAGLVEHVGRGRYRYALEKRIAAGLSGDEKDQAAAIAADLEAAFVD